MKSIGVRPDSSMVKEAVKLLFFKMAVDFFRWIICTGIVSFAAWRILS
jgi:hypothetical protein